jgi:hypothetical protein
VIGVLYPSGAICPVGTVGQALAYAETSTVPTRLVRRVGDKWSPDRTLPHPRPRCHATAEEPQIVAPHVPRAADRGRGKSRQPLAEATSGTTNR